VAGIPVQAAQPEPSILSWGFPVPYVQFSSSEPAQENGQPTSNMDLSIDSNAGARFPGNAPAKSPAGESGATAQTPAQSSELAFGVTLVPPTVEPESGEAAGSAESKTNPAGRHWEVPPDEPVRPAPDEAEALRPVMQVRFVTASNSAESRSEDPERNEKAALPDSRIEGGTPAPATPSQNNFTGAPSHARETEPARPAPPDPPQPPATPRDVSLRLADGERSVDLHMMDRGGEIRVMVHTPDRDLASSLRSDLPDLVSKLRQNGFQAESWRPAASSETPDSGQRHGGGDFSSASQHGSADNRREHRQQPKPDQPRWAGEWNASTGLVSE
jgi:hypothetical protein